MTDLHPTPEGLTYRLAASLYAELVGRGATIRDVERLCDEALDVPVLVFIAMALGEGTHYTRRRTE